VIEVEIDKDVYLPCFHHLLSDDPSTSNVDIELVWGGRDSGKSKHVAMQLLEESMTLDYFRCILVKETFESIKDAQWQMLKDTAESWKVDSLFNFKTSPLSIKVANGNTFIARGMDKPGKIRSITNPSHVWVEEGNQISEDAFITLLTSLRSDFGRVKLIITFNPEANCADYQEFWLYKQFFKDHEPKRNFTGVLTVKDPKTGKPIKDENGNEISVTYRSTHVTYHDNSYVTAQRKAFHESLEKTNPYWHGVFTKGEWGNQENDSPWAFAFNQNKHVSDGIKIPHPELNRAHPLYACFDFNRNPMACGIIQWYDNQVRVLEAIKIPKSGVDAVCDFIKVNYPGCLYIVTGDYSGMTETSLFAEQVTHYKLIKHHLSLSDGQIKVQPNPKLAKNSTHVNSILAYYNVVIHGEKGKALIFDLKNVKRRADGTILKEDRDDPTQQSDSLDWFRYFCNNFLDWFKPVF
jgi:phage terminase large subunit